ncbi:hypothetical protein Nepgr_020819 [Nepenthes gracilis]|uniref:Uncharacterized protein n=1 Tax=Nepenthes gracilis TaxID=150966 RepID=A0AAD3SVY9_NEPGR|nr:hypothetical protein Nepgr_020819 [Nepenthes gracilis]
MSGGAASKSLGKALRSIKDTTTISLAKVNNDYKPYFLQFQRQDLELMRLTAYMLLRDGYPGRIIGR